MKTDGDYKDFIGSLDQQQLDRFKQFFGGDSCSVDTAVRFVAAKEGNEDILCEAIWKVFSIRILSARQRQEQAALAASRATVEAATHAREANTIADQANALSEASNKLSHQANEKAERSLSIAEQSLAAARQTKFWTMVASVVATLAFILSVIALFISLAKKD